MKNLALIIALSIVTIKTQAQQNYIRGGQNVVEGTYPFIAELRIWEDTKSQCGGALIAPQWVISAGHCMYTKNANGEYTMLSSDQLTIRLNSVNNAASINPNGGVISEVEAIYKLPTYNMTTPISNGMDIVLLKLKKPVTSIEPLGLPSPSDMEVNYRDGRLVNITGWGLIENEPNNIGTNILQHAMSKIYSFNDCKEFYGYLADNTFCIGYTANDEKTRLATGAGAGDSGSPAWISDNGKLKAIGIVSGGISNLTSADQPGIFTKVAYYRDWIDSIIATHTYDNPTNINDPNAQKGAYIATNNNQLNISIYPSNIKWTQINVVDISGRILINKNIEDTQESKFQLDISNFTNGIYAVQLISNRSHHQQVEKIIVYK